MHQVTLEYHSQCKFALGAYVQAHDEPQPSNTQEPRTINSIYLWPIPHGHQVYSLETRAIIERRTVTEQPVTPP